MVTATVARPGAASARVTDGSPFAVFSLTLLLLALGYFVLVRPDASFAERFLNEAFGLADGAWRVANGQVPSVDFVSPYGAATYLPTAAGLLLDYSVGGALAFGHFLTAAFLLPLMCLAARRRVSTLPALVLVVFAFLLVLAPVRLGGSYADLTWGVDYTRQGWAGLAVALLYYLEPRRIGRRDLWVDTVVLTLLLLFLFYLSMTFALVAGAFAIANAMTSGYKLRLGIAALAACVAAITILETTSGYSSAHFTYLRDVFSGAAPSWLDIDGLIDLTLDHRLEIFLCYSGLAVVFAMGRRSLSDFLFVTGCLAASLLLLDQSGQTNRVLPGLVTVLIILAELAQRRELGGTVPAGHSGWSRQIVSSLVLAMALSLTAQPAYAAARGLWLHYEQLAEARYRGEPDLAGIYVPRLSVSPTADLHAVLGHDDEAHDQLHVQRPPKLGTREYALLVEEGLKLLHSVPLEGKAVVTFEQTSPFGVVLGLRPTASGDPLGSINPGSLERAEADGRLDREKLSERFFSDTDYVMVPELPHSAVQLDLMENLYGDYLDRNFRELKRSSHWRLYERR